MIRQDATLRIQRIPLCDIHVCEYEVRFPETLLGYITALMEHPDCDMELLHLKPSPIHAKMYALANGYHKFCAHIMAGRRDALCVVEEPA
jgi:hypothetical protein